jgi:hypothetical protein
MKTPTTGLIAVLGASALLAVGCGFGADWYVLAPSGAKVDNS